MTTRARPSVCVAGIGTGFDRRGLTAEVEACIRSADLVLYPGEMIGEEVRRMARGRALFGRGRGDAEIRGAVRDAVDAGGTVAWLEPGDPSLYSGEPGVFGSLSENLAWMRAEGIAYQVLPGVSNVHALAARVGLEHAGPDSGCPLVVYAPGRDPRDLALERLTSFCRLGVPMALLLGSERLDDVVRVVGEVLGPTTRFVIGDRVGWPDEWIVDTTVSQVASTLGARPLSQHSTVLVGPWHGGPAEPRVTNR